MMIPQIPYSLKSLDVNDYRGIRHLHLEGLPANTPWIFLTGQNGFGKTSVLQAIALGLWGIREVHTYPIKEEFEPQIKVTAWNTSMTYIIPRVVHTLEGNFDFLACYGSERLNIQSEESENQNRKTSTTTYSLFESGGNLKNIEYELKLSKYDAKERFEAICNMLKQLIPNLAEIKVEDREVIYYERDQDGNSYEPVKFHQLAAGIRSIIAMVGDIYIRLSTIEGNSEAPQKNKWLPESLEGIVIIDELDLHLHPKWQRELPTLLSNVFPKVQFIASTHSPIPLLGAPEESVFLKVNRSQEMGITIEKIDIDIRNLTANVVLTSPIFDMDEIFAKTNKDTRSLRTEDDFAEMEFNDQVQEKLTEIAQKGNLKLDEIFKK
jgi:predicted ATP-binding protein involved in virulence